MTHDARRRGGIPDEQGTILVVTVVAMLILGILAVSFAALGNLEIRIGLNDVWDKQAALVAEGGIAAARSQVQNPPDYTAFLGHVYSCTTSSCSCTGAGCGTARLSTMTTGEFSVRVDNDPDDPSGNPAVDGNKQVMFTALGITRGATGGVMGRARLRAWVVNDDPWKHVCSSGDGVLCTDPPNNPNAEITPPDPNNENGPRTFPQIPVPNNIRTTPCSGCAVNVAAPFYPVPTGQTPPGAPRGPSVMYPYYLTALTTACTQCNPATSAYDPVTCNAGSGCMGMVRFESSVSLQSGAGGGGAKMIIPTPPFGSPTNGVTVYVMGKLDIKGDINQVYGTLVFHGGGDAGSGGSQTDLHFQGPNHITAKACASCAQPSYPLAILGYNPNEPAPPGQTIYLDISNNGVIIDGVVYTGGTVDFGPNTVNGSVLGYKVNANNGATEFNYVAYTPPPPPGFSTPEVNLPSVIARGTWLQCRTADNLTDPCD